MQGGARAVKTIALVLCVALAPAAFAADPATVDDIGSLLWLERTGGALDRKEALRFVWRAVGPVLRAVLRRAPAAEQVDLAKLAPPDTPMVKAAVKLLDEKASAPFKHHAYRTAYWTLVVMKRERAELTPQDLEVVWVAALLHDLGLEQPPAQGEFTQAGVAAVRQLAEAHKWDKASTLRACEAISLNPNAHVDRDTYGLLAWAMNVGGWAEVSLSPYRGLMGRENLRELEEKHPRAGFHEAAPRAVGAELARFPDGRFSVLRTIGFLHRRLDDGGHADLEVVFLIDATLLGLSWLLLLLLPGRRAIAFWWCGVLVPALVLLTGMVLFVWGWFHPRGSLIERLGSVGGLQQLLASRAVLLGVWLQLAAFTLAAGGWVARRGRATELRHVLLLPCLVLTALCPPLGLSVFVLTQIGRRRMGDLYQ